MTHLLLFGGLDLLGDGGQHFNEVLLFAELAPHGGPDHAEQGPEHELVPLTVPHVLRSLLQLPARK